MKKVFLAAGVILLGIGVFIAALNQPRTVNMAPEITPVPASTKTSLWLPILVYHHIGQAPKNADSVTKSFFIETEWFEKHLQYLQENNFQTVHFSDVAAYFEKGTPLPLENGKHPVMINFDDAFKSVFDAALPLLEKYHVTATVFVPANLVGHRAYLTWEQLQELNREDIEIESHSLWHPYLTRSKKAHEEIFESKKILEEKLGVPVQAFAYPFGDYDDRIIKLVQEAGYSLARTFSTGNGISRENLFKIPVVRVYANVGLERWKSQLYPPPPMLVPRTPLSPY